ncbi:hypothetical protein [Streptomyces violascens]|uniref:hypothetical protein n=1 Tax=Streptomyces violascens TaxID=67381 RepID=UPI0016719970|nr:hypothetical protein [Streptomyces violascens]GGU42920.1 hypothetical protein GCM10010289_74620 [Streptomyces violascens]
MIRQFFRTPRRRLVTLAVLAAAVAAVGWYAVQPVHPTCTVYSGAYVPATASAAEAITASQQAYEKALADGACRPSHARFHDWID